MSPYGGVQLSVFINTDTGMLAEALELGAILAALVPELVTVAVRTPGPEPRAVAIGAARAADL